MSLSQPDLIYEVTSFAPGFLDSPEATRLPKGGTPSAANCLFTGIAEDGSCTLAKRTGCRLVNPACIVAGVRVDQVYEYRRESTGTAELLAVCNGGLYKWDGANAFTLISALGYAANAVVRFDTFRNVAFVTDGTTMFAYDGTTVFSIGFAKPTAAPALAVVAGPGVTGTYQGLAVWYDSTHDHESSPSDANAAGVVFANQQRQWTKPAGAPPANVDKWRVYCRRTDTNEVYYKFVAEVAIATANVTEQVTDATRNLATTGRAPLPNQNDVPSAFALFCNALGYVFGVPTNSSDVSVSALGDGQGYHPKDKISVNKGDGRGITTLKSVGTAILAQKARRSWLLEGDRMPFVPNELTNSFGNHSQESSVEAVGFYWAWDPIKGPYKSDLRYRWTPLADGKLGRLLKTVNLNAEIRCEHVPAEKLIVWIVATGAATRTRTMLAFNYLVGAWLPPITGIEYASFTPFQLSDGTSTFFVGDYWGRVYRYFVDDLEGPPSGTLIARVSAGTGGTVTCDVELDDALATACAFYTTNNGLKGMTVGARSPAGAWQFRTIQSNTAGVITLDLVNGSAWTAIPAAGWTVVVGGIDWYWATALVDFGGPLRKKKGGHVYAELRAAGRANAHLVVVGRLNDTTAGPTVNNDMAFMGSAGWGSGVWGTMLWGSGPKQPARQRLSRSFFALQLEVSNRYPNQPMELVTFGITADKVGTWAHSGA